MNVFRPLGFAILFNIDEMGLEAAGVLGALRTTRALVLPSVAAEPTAITQ